MSILGMTRRKKGKKSVSGIDAAIAAALAAQEEEKAQQPTEIINESPSSLEAYGRGYGQAATAPIQEDEPQVPGGMQEYGTNMGAYGVEQANEVPTGDPNIRVGKAFGEGVKTVLRDTAEGAAALTDPQGQEIIDRNLDEPLRGEEGAGELAALQRRAREYRSATEPQEIKKKRVEAIKALPSYHEMAKAIAQMDALAADPNFKYNEGASGFIEKVIGTAPQIIGQVLIGMIPAVGPALSMGDMGLQIIGSEYQNSIQQGATHEDAKNMALLSAVIQMPLESIGLKGMTKFLPVKTAIAKKIKSLITAGLTEGLTEFIQEYPSAITHLLATKPDMKVLKAISDMLTSPQTLKSGLESGAIGAILGVGVHGALNARMEQPENIPTPTPTDEDIVGGPLTPEELATITPEEQAAMDAFAAGLPATEQGFIDAKDAANNFSSTPEGGQAREDFVYNKVNDEDREQLKKLGLPDFYIDGMRAEDARATLIHEGKTPSTKSPIPSGPTKTTVQAEHEAGRDAETMRKNAGVPIQEHIAAAKEGITPAQQRGMKELIDEKNWNEQRDRLLAAGLSEEFIETLRPEGAKIYNDQYKIDRMKEAGISDEGIKAMMEAEKTRDEKKKTEEPAQPVKPEVKPEPKKDKTTFDLGAALKEDAVQKTLDEQEANVRKQIPNMKGIQLRKLWLNKGYSQKLRDEAKARLDKLTPAEPVKQPKPKPVNLMPKAGEKEIVKPAASEAVSEPSYKSQDLNKMSLSELQAVQKNKNTSKGVKNMAKNILRKRIAARKAKEALAKKQVKKPSPKPKETVPVPKTPKPKQVVPAKEKIVEKPVVKEERPTPPPIKDTPNYTSDAIEKTIVNEYEHLDLDDVPSVREVKMSGEQYLDLTTGSDKISNMVKRHVKEATEPLTTDQAISLEVDQEGNVVNHDGRHRAWKQHNAVPVVLIPSSPDVDLSKITSLKSQKFGKTSRGAEVSVQQKRKVITPTVEKKKVPRLPETANPEHKNYVEDVWDLTDKQRRNELKKLIHHTEIPHVAERAEQLAEMQKQRDAKQSREGITKSTLLPEQRKEAILKAREDGTLTPKMESDLFNKFFNPKTGEPLPPIRGAARGIAAGSKTLTIEPEDLIQGAYELGLYYTATGTAPKTNSAVRGLMKKYLAEDAPLTASETAVRSGEVKVTRTGNENFMDALIAGSKEKATGATQTTRKGTGEVETDDVNIEGSEAAVNYAEQKPGMAENTGIESNEDYETGKIFAEQASIDTDTDITYEGNNVFRINNGAHEGTTFNVDMSAKNIVLSDVSKAAKSRMNAREKEAQARGREAMPEVKVIRKRRGVRTIVKDTKAATVEDDRKKAMDEWNEKQRLIRAQEQEEIEKKKATTEDVKPDAAKVDEELNNKLDDDSTFPSEPTEDVTLLYSGVPIPPAVQKWVKSLWKNMAKYFQIGASIDQAGEAGIAQMIVAQNSNTQAHMERELREVRELENLVRETMPDATREELTDVVVAYENKDYFKELSTAKRKRYAPVVQWLTKYFKNKQAMLKEKTGQDLDYVRRGLERAKKKLWILEGSGLTEAKRDKYIERAVAEIELYKQLQYAPIPVALLEHQLGKIKRKFKGKQRDVRLQKTVDFMHEMAKKRRVKTLKGLLDNANKEDIKLTITPTELAGLYTYRISKDLALHDIILEMEKAGLVQKKVKGEPAPKGFKAVSNAKYPALSKYVVKARGRKILDSLVEVDMVGNIYDKFNSRAKIMQFFNPLIMAWNDVQQGIGSGAYFGKSTLKIPSTILKANRAMREKNDLYLDLKKYGLFSKPIAYSKPDILKEVRKITAAKLDGSAVGGWFRRQGTRIESGMEFDAKTKPGKAVKLVDEVVMGSVHGAAWAIDEQIRLVTAISLMEKGHSRPEAAKLAAMAHGDYASVPKGSRKLFNRVLFTPTFKIVMMAMNIKMYKDSWKTISMYSTGKGKNVTKMQKAMLGALITRTVMEGAMHMVLKSVGYDLEDDKWWNYGTRYVNHETGTNLVIPSPFNIGRRIFGKAMKQFGRGGKGIADAASLWKVLQGDVAILPRLAYETLISNRRWDGTKITNEFDTPQVKLLKQVIYSIGRVIAVGGMLERNLMDEESIESGYGQRIKEKQANLSTMRKALEKIKPWYSGPVTPKDQRIAQQVRALKSKFQSEINKAAKAGKLTDDMINKWEKEFTYRMFKVIDEENREETRRRGGNDLRDKFRGIKIDK